MDSDNDNDNIRQTLDVIEDLAVNAPSALTFLVINVINELRGAVDDGHANPELLRDVVVHAIKVAQMEPHSPPQ